MREVFEAMGEGKKILAIGAGHKIPERLEMYPTMITLTHPPNKPLVQMEKKGGKVVGCGSESLGL